MTQFCDRTLCDGMFKAMGHYVFGDPKAKVITMVAHRFGGGAQSVPIKYCPFCGTRLDNLVLVASGEVFFVPDLPESE